jgi:5-methylcytosine-specific restriction endonuclease McrA
LSCSSCNLIKATATTGHDPEIDEVVPLFNPRQQIWREHFEWLESGLRLRGKTPIGRATIQRLKMNQQRFLRARANWIKAGNHPPALDIPE